MIKQSFRIYAEILDLQSFSPDILRTYLIQFEQLGLLDIPLASASAMKGPLYWDIGVIHVSGKFEDFYL
jgi:hypothetical protein